MKTIKVNIMLNVQEYIYEATDEWKNQKHWLQESITWVESDKSKPTVTLNVVRDQRVITAYL